MERQNPYLNNIAFFLLMVFAFVMMLSNFLAEFLATAMLLIWMAQSLAYRRADWLDYPLFKPIVALIGYKILVLLVSGYQGQFGAAFEQLILPLLYFIVPTIVVTYERRRKIAWLLISGAVFAAGVGMIRYASGAAVKAESFISGSYTLAIYIVVVLVMVLCLFAYAKKFGEKFFIGLVSIPLITGLIYTFSRASYLAAAVFILVLGILKDRKILILVICVLALVYIFNPQGIDQIKKRFDTSNISLFYSHRDVLVELGLPEINKVGFFGNGINSFPELVDVEKESLIRNKTINSWHNMYLEYILDDGPLGLVLLFWLFFNQIRYSLARFRKTQELEHKIYQLSFVFLIIIILILGFFTNPMRDPVISMLTWTMLGLSLI